MKNAKRFLLKLVYIAFLGVWTGFIIHRTTGDGNLAFASTIVVVTLIAALAKS